MCHAENLYLKLDDFEILYLGKKLTNIDTEISDRTALSNLSKI